MKFYKYLYTYSPHAIIIPWGRGSRPQTKSDSGVIMENLYTQIDLFVTNLSNRIDTMESFKATIDERIGELEEVQADLETALDTCRDISEILEGLTNGMGDADDAIAKAEDLAL